MNEDDSKRFVVRLTKQQLVTTMACIETAQIELSEPVHIARCVEALNALRAFKVEDQVH
jgi:hypothetical protein